jgi:hypothetical protein
MSTEPTIHLVIESGPEQGRRLTVPEAGARMGRSSQNDIELTDPAVSRFQCRVFFKPDDTLWVSDLGSTNQTVVNGQPILETILNLGDTLEMGETILRVVHNRLRGAPGAVPPPPPAASPADIENRQSAIGNEPPPAPADPAPVDLGLGPSAARSATIAREARTSRQRLIWIVVVLALGAVTAALIAKRPWEKAAAKSAPTPAVRLSALDITYEKVRGDTSNIFRYALSLQGRALTVQVDSLTENRHVRREKSVETEVLGRLVGDLERVGFFTLDESYQGVLPDVYEATDLTLAMGERAHRVQVLNRVEPEAFKKAREIIEDFARNELGLAAVSLPPEKLLELGRDAVLLGQKLFAEREVRFENLYRAILAFEEAQWYVETLEPKPDYYGSAINGLEECKRALQESYDNHRFQADRAVKLRDWAGAAQHLRIICDLIPDRADERHAQAAKMLLDVERRVER